MEPMTQEELAEIEADVEVGLLEAAVAELCQGAGLSRDAVARALEASRAGLASEDRRAGRRLCWLRRVVERLGGRVEVVARIGVKRVRVPA